MINALNKSTQVKVPQNCNKYSTCVKKLLFITAYETPLGHVKSNDLEMTLYNSDIRLQGCPDPEHTLRNSDPGLKITIV